MAKTILKVVSTVDSKLSTIPVKDGQLIFVYDKKKIVLDNHGNRTIYEQIQTLEKEEHRTGMLAPIDSFYFVIETSILWRYTNGHWNQITTSPQEQIDRIVAEGTKQVKAVEGAGKALTEAITESRTAITEMNKAIKNAGTAVEETVAATNETKKATEAAQSAESKLSQSTADAEELKTALDQVVGGVAQDATAEEILKILQKSADYMAQIAESAGKAGSLNGFGLNLLEDGSVSLTYSNPDTGELQDSAIFPKETTLTALDKALGEMNESLKIIALREGGAL